MSLSLVSLLIQPDSQENLGPHYEKLFTKLFPIKKKEVWALTKVSPKEHEKIEYFQKLAEEIASSAKQNVENSQNQAKLKEQKITIHLLPHLEQFVICFNREWTKVRLKPHVIVEAIQKMGQEILFNSKSSHFHWLSNFYDSFILEKTDSQDQKMWRLFLNVENAYQSSKVKESNASLYVELSGFMESSKAKKRSKAYSPSTDCCEASIREERKVIMRKYECLKYKQNPILKDLLLETKDKTLKEDTNSSFWSTVLGNILMDVRQDIKSSDSPVDGTKERGCKEIIHF